MVHRRSGRRLVIAFFESSRARHVASLVLQEAPTPKETQGTVGVLALDGRGRVDVAMLGERTTDDGPGIGAVLGAIGLALAGKDAPRRGPFSRRHEAGCVGTLRCRSARAIASRRAG